jgi:hypothetical protein
MPMTPELLAACALSLVARIGDSGENSLDKGGAWLDIGDRSLSSPSGAVDVAVRIVMIEIHGLEYANPIQVGSIDDCSFYHWMDLPDIPSASGVRTVKGSWDLRRRFRDYTGHVDFCGKSVLDVGVATGWISFEAEKHGATEVVGVDLPEGDRPQYVPYFIENSSTTISNILSYADRLRKSYWLCHSRYGSTAKIVYCNIYNIGHHIRNADIVIVGQILVHLRDPLHALWQCAQAASDTLIIVEGCFEHGEPLMRFHGLNKLMYSWFHLSTTMYKEYLKILGFEVLSMTKNLYHCSHYENPDAEVWTIVAKRISETAQFGTI